MVQQSEVSCRMNEKEKKNEQKNTVVEAMLRAREKEMQQPPTEEELPGLTPEEYDDMYLKIVGRLKAEGLLRKEDMEDGGSETEDTGKEGVFRKENVSGTMSSGEVSEEKRTEPETAEKIPAEKEQTKEEEIRKEPVSRRPGKNPPLPAKSRESRLRMPGGCGRDVRTLHDQRSQPPAAAPDGE